MSFLESLNVEERARQLRDPIGATGLAVAEALDQSNRDGNVGIISQLEISQGSRVLEIGCGTGGMAEIVINQAENVFYTGLDRSKTMIDAALSRRADLITRGAVEFELSPSESMPFENSLFARVFSVGVIHFWPDPTLALAEVRRVMRPDGLMLMGCLGPEHAPPFARSEYGFYLHEPRHWRSFCEAAGFHSVELKTGRLGPTGSPQILQLAGRA